MPAVTPGTMIGPDGTILAGVDASFRLVDAAGNPVPVAWLTATDKTIVGAKEITTDANGTYSITLPGNADITPAGTRWRRRIYLDGERAINTLLDVPTTGGPYQEEDLAVDAIPDPGPVDSAGRGLIASWKLSGTDSVPISTTSITDTTIAGLGGTFTVTDRPIWVHFAASWVYTDAAGKTGMFRVRVDGTPVESRTVEAPSTGSRLHVDLWVPQTALAAGDHTIDVQWRAGAAGTTLSLFPLSVFGEKTPTYCEVIEW